VVAVDVMAMGMKCVCVERGRSEGLQPPEG
jgi:hypothetical protein